MCASEIIKICDYEIPKNKITYSDFYQIGYFDISMTQCVDKMTTFKWSAGTFCLTSQFCGLGLKMFLDEIKIFNTTRLHIPALESCQILLDISKLTCHDVKEAMMEQRLISRNYFMRFCAPASVFDPAVTN